jgi:hypothetical protein
MADRIPARLSALLGSRAVEWALEHRMPEHSYRLRNLGTLAARDVSILGGSPPASTSLARIEPGTAITVDVDPDRHSHAIEVTWRENDSPTPTRLTLPLPPALEHPSG